MSLQELDNLNNKSHKGYLLNVKHTRNYSYLHAYLFNLFYTLLTNCLQMLIHALAIYPP